MLSTASARRCRGRYPGSLSVSGSYQVDECRGDQFVALSHGTCRRDLSGDEMTTAEKAKSVANEAKEELLAEYDARSGIRKHT